MQNWCTTNLDIVSPNILSNDVSGPRKHKRWFFEPPTLQLTNWEWEEKMMVKGLKLHTFGKDMTGPMKHKKMVLWAEEHVITEKKAASCKTHFHFVHLMANMLNKDYKIEDAHKSKHNIDNRQHWIRFNRKLIGAECGRNNKHWRRFAGEDFCLGRQFKVRKWKKMQRKGLLTVE